MIIADRYGWLLLILSYVFVFLYKDSRINFKLLLSLLFVLTLHHAVAVIDVYITQTMGASVDAVTFHRTAVDLASNHSSLKFVSGPYFYPLLLSFFYQLFNPSMFLGEELSVFAFLFSCFFFIEICKLVNLNKYTPLLIILFGSLPSMILLGSIIMRESWQILFLMATLYFSLKNLFFNSLLGWFGIFISSFMLCLFHEGFIIFVTLLGGILVLFHLLKSTANLYTRVFSILFTLLSLVLIGVILDANISKMPELEAYHALVNGKSFDFVTRYHNRVLEIPDSRTIYTAKVDSTSMLDAAIVFLDDYIHYMFAPFPWQITNVSDLYAASESLIRFFLILVALYVCYTAKEDKKLLSFILISYILMSVLWSLGTINYGTSIRHQIVSYWMLIIMFGIWLDRMSDPRKNTVLQSRMI